jgi:glycosyltransferase involved in cell wall biosynthesis
MPDTQNIGEKIRSLRCCVIIPTYNNAGTLEQVLRRVGEFTGSVIVVNDGSTDGTEGILDRWAGGEVDRRSAGEVPGTVLTLPGNSGKGIALRQGFAYAIGQGYRYAITLDSDCQHFPEDIPRFLEAIEKEPEALIIGARNMSQEGVPGTSTFGHKFSIFWFRVETGLKVPDVQSGYRLYPLDRIGSIRHFFSSRFEFEVEVLVRLAWRGVPIVAVPVKTWYAPKQERVSHFRKGTDFARASLLNAILVFAAILWVRPFHFAKGLRKKSFREILREQIINSQDSNIKLAWSVSLGVFVGVLPVWGWQMVIAVSLAHFLRLNKFVALVASNISIPPFLPLILFLSYLSGGFVLGNETAGLVYSTEINFQWVKQNLIQYVIGSVVFGAVLSPLAGAVTYVLLRIFRRHRKSTEPITG